MQCQISIKIIKNTLNRLIYMLKNLIISLTLIFIISGCNKNPKHKNKVTKIKNKTDFSVGHYPYTLPKLGYAYDSLEPHLDAKTMEIHYTKHHQAYVDNLNKALKDYPELHDKDLSELLKDPTIIPISIKTAVINHGGGHYNHSFYWTGMSSGGGKLSAGDLAKKIDDDFGSFDAFKKEFINAAKTKFGSGWAWLSLDNSGKLVVTVTSNQDSPLSDGLIPLLTLDVWEHAYYLKYQNKRADFIEAWWNVVNWKEIEARFQALKNQS